jgi:hypothetical protein
VAAAAVSAGRALEFKPPKNAAKSEAPEPSAETGSCTCNPLKKLKLVTGDVSSVADPSLLACGSPPAPG